jgi:hypothetical protein
MKSQNCTSVIVRHRDVATVHIGKSLRVFSVREQEGFIFIWGC